MLTKIAGAVLAATAFGSAHATITVSTSANCNLYASQDGLKQNSSMTFQQPYLYEWSFELTQTNYTAAGVETVQGAHFGPAMVLAAMNYPVGYPVYQAVGNHFGADGYAYYVVTTSASTCVADRRTYQEPTHLSAAGAAMLAPVGAAGQSAGASAAGARGVRIDTASSVMPSSKYQQLRQTWALLAPRAAAEGVAAMLSDTKHASFEQALTQHQERLTFTAAQTGSTELAKLTPAKSLPAGNAADAGWSGYTRVYRTGPHEWVMLEELDLQALQASVVILREAINADVNGSPALLRSASADGVNLTALTWIANGKRYSLKTNAAPAKASDRLLAIARGLY